MSALHDLPIFSLLRMEATHSSNIFPLPDRTGQLVRNASPKKFVALMVNDDYLDGLLLTRIRRLENHGLTFLGSSQQVEDTLGDLYFVHPDGINRPSNVDHWTDISHGDLVKSIQVEDFSFCVWRRAKIPPPHPNYPDDIAGFGELVLSSVNLASAFLSMPIEGRIRADPSILEAMGRLHAPAMALVRLVTKSAPPPRPLSGPKKDRPRASGHYRRAKPPVLASPSLGGPSNKGKSKRARSPSPPIPTSPPPKPKKKRNDPAWARREVSVPLSDTTEISIHSAPSPPHVIDEPLEDIEMEHVAVAEMRECFGGLSKLGDDGQRAEVRREILVEDMDWEAEGLQHGEVIEPEDDEIGPLAMVIWEDPLRVYPVLPIVEVRDPWEHVEEGVAEEEDVLEIPRPPAEDGLPRMAYHGDRLHAGDIRDGPILYRLWVEILIGQPEEEE